MSSTPTTPAPSKLQGILQIIQLALAGLQAVPVTSLAAGLASTFLGIFQSATTLYQQETGQPFDVTKIPLEQPVP
jgi:hypothetical protein